MMCSLGACDKPVHGRGLCNMHLRRLRKHGATDDTRTSPMTRFWPNVDETEGGCWVWTGNVDNSTGYGRVRLRGNKVLVHRYAYELLVGPIPDGLHIDHLCRVRHCVNPDHMEPVTCKENVLRGEGLSARNSQKTHCKRGHEFTEANTYHPPHKAGGTRACRECRRYLDRRRRARYGPGDGP